MRGVLAALAAIVALGACASGPAASDVVERDRFGYRVLSDEDRETVLLRPVTDSTQFLLYPAVVQGVTVRPAGRPAPGDGVAVEVLVEGALPDACAELSSVEQDRQLRFIDVTLWMRTPSEAVCAAVVRPFRFYLMLDGAFEAGSYTLRLNDTPYPFQVLPAPDADASDDGL